MKLNEYNYIFEDFLDRYQADELDNDAADEVTAGIEKAEYVEDAYEYPLVIRFYNAPVTSPADLPVVLDLLPKWVSRWRRIFDYTPQITEYGIMKPKACGNRYKTEHMPWDWIEEDTFEQRSYEFPSSNGIVFEIGVKYAGNRVNEFVKMLIQMFRAQKIGFDHGECRAVVQQGRSNPYWNKNDTDHFRVVFDMMIKIDNLVNNVVEPRKMKRYFEDATGYISAFKSITEMADFLFPEQYYKNYQDVIELTKGKYNGPIILLEIQTFITRGANALMGLHYNTNLVNTPYKKKYDKVIFDTQVDVGYMEKTGNIDMILSGTENPCYEFQLAECGDIEYEDAMKLLSKQPVFVKDFIFKRAKEGETIYGLFAAHVGAFDDGTNHPIDITLLIAMSNLDNHDNIERFALLLSDLFQGKIDKYDTINAIWKRY